jgi:ferredoxin, 2Fe-2S
MPTVVFVYPRRAKTSVQVEPGTSLMESAVDNGIDGILGTCGGLMKCGTYHVYLAGDPARLVHPLDEVEDEILDMV